jgi:hypothetical protein
VGLWHASPRWIDLNKYLLQNVLYLSSFVKIALVASAVPCAAVIERTQLAVMPSHNRIAPSFDAVTYMAPVQEYLTYKIDKETIQSL